MCRECDFNGAGTDIALKCMLTTPRLCGMHLNLHDCLPYCEPGHSGVHGMQGTSYSQTHMVNQAHGLVDVAVESVSKKQHCYQKQRVGGQALVDSFPAPSVCLEL